MQFSDFKAAASRNLVGTFGKTPASGWYTMILTSTAYPYVNSSVATQFRLRFARNDNNDWSADYPKFCNSNHTTAGVPLLQVEYHLP
ncbi:MAG: hypothetical protein A2Z03_09490 [Chloroflexi bacterium RBG_16_56_8]|nr:MAG: hypothetical protein A2Z03_09490 [Chloroflexi bacterium RBG_16_56_8]